MNLSLAQRERLASLLKHLDDANSVDRLQQLEEQARHVLRRTDSPGFSDAMYVVSDSTLANLHRQEYGSELGGLLFREHFRQTVETFRRGLLFYLRGSLT